MVAGKKKPDITRDASQNLIFSERPRQVARHCWLTMTGHLARVPTCDEQ